MPTLDTFIPETTIQIVEPVSEQIARSVLNVMGLASIFKDNLFIKSNIQNSSKFNTDKDRKRTPSNRCDVDIIPNYNPAELAWDTFKSMNTDIHASTDRGTFGDYPLLSDRRAKADLYEVSVPCSVELEFKFKLKSIELADLVSNTLYGHAMSTGSVFNYNDILFSYPIADKMLIMLYKLYSFQDEMSSKLTFQEYLTYCSGDKIEILLNRHQLESGSKEVIIRRSNTLVIGQSEYSGNKPDVEESNKTVDRYTIDFKYTYQFSRPALLRLIHPLMVNNRLFGSKLVRKPVSMSIPNLSKTHPNIAINKHWLDRNEKIDLYKSYPLVRYPEYDEWYTSSLVFSDYHLKYQSLFIGILSVDVDPNTGDQSLTIDIENDVFPMLDPLLATELKKVANLSMVNDILRRQSIFNISVFSNNNIVDFNNLVLDIDQHVDMFLTINTPIDIMKTYRFVISFIRDITILPAKFIYYMLDNHEYYTDFLTSNIKYLEQNKYIKILINELTSEPYIETPARYIQPPSTGNRHGYGRAITLGKYTIITNRRNL